MVFVYAVASAFKANRVNIMFGNGRKLNSALWVPAIPALKTQVTESSSMLLSECVWYCGSCCGCGLKKIVL